MPIDQSALDKCRKIQIELLDEFVHICEENDLTYFLIFGTLLGAVRHKGFIPWDDDIDIAMPRKDYEIFLRIKVFKKDLYYIHSVKNDKNFFIYQNGFAKFCKKDTVFAEKNKNPDCYSGIFIDIFPYDNCVLSFLPLQSKMIEYTRRLYHIKKGIKKSQKKNIRKLIENIILFFFSENMMISLHRKFHLSFYFLKTKYICFFSGEYRYKRKTFKNNDIFPLSKIQFGEKDYNVPNNCDSILRTLYDEYMEIPPIEKQKNHEPLYIDFGDG